MSQAIDLHSTLLKVHESIPLIHILLSDLSTKSVLCSDQLLKSILTLFLKLIQYYSGNQFWNPSSGHLSLIALSHWLNNSSHLEKLPPYLALIKNTNEIGMKSSKPVKNFQVSLFLKEFKETELTQRSTLILWKLQKRELFKLWTKQSLHLILMIILSSKFMSIIKSFSVLL